MISRTETFGNTTHKQYHLGLIDEHYFIVEKNKHDIVLFEPLR